MTAATEARAYWGAYVAANGGLTETARKLGIAYSTVANVTNGNRGISPRLARRMTKADPLLDANRIVWVEALPAAERKRPKPAQAAA